MNGFQIFLTFVGTLAGIWALSTVFHMVRDKIRLSKEKRTVKKLEELEEEERKLKYKDGGNTDKITEKEVQENDRRDEDQRRVLTKLRDLESRKRRVKETDRESPSKRGSEGRSDVQNDSSIKSSSTPKKSGRADEKTRNVSFEEL